MSAVKKIRAPVEWIRRVPGETDEAYAERLYDWSMLIFWAWMPWVLYPRFRDLDEENRYGWISRAQAQRL